MTCVLKTRNVLKCESTLVGYQVYGHMKILLQDSSFAVASTSWCRYSSLTPAGIDSHWGIDPIMSESTFQSSDLLFTQNVAMCALVNATHAFFAFLRCGCTFKRAAWCLSLVLCFHRKRKEKSFVDVHSYILHVSVTEFRKWTRSFFFPELSRTILYIHETALTSV